MAAFEYLDLVLTGVGSTVAGAGVAGIFGRRKVKSEVEKATAEVKRTDAETADIIANAALKLLEPLTVQIERLESRVGTLETEVLRLESENCSLRRHIETLEGNNDYAGENSGA